MEATVESVESRESLMEFLGLDCEWRIASGNKVWLGRRARDNGGPRVVQHAGEHGRARLTKPMPAFLSKNRYCTCTSYSTSKCTLTLQSPLML